MEPFPKQRTVKPFVVSLVVTLLIIGGGYGGYTFLFKKKERTVIAPTGKEQQQIVQKKDTTTPQSSIDSEVKTQPQESARELSKEEEQEIPIIPQPILYPEDTPTQALGAPDSTPTLYPMTVKTTAISVELAETREQQEKGLGGRTGLAEDRGLLYILAKPDFYTFWMKNMKFPIDIIWIDKNQKVVDISHSLTPDTYPRIFQPVHPAQIILEVSVGFAKKHGIEIGDPVTVPKIQQ